MKTGRPWNNILDVERKLLGQNFVPKTIKKASMFWLKGFKKEMATHFSILAWRIPWTEEPGGLQSMGSQRVGYD